jgi:hypothetical protein
MKPTHVQLVALERGAFKPYEAWPSTIDALLRRGWIERDGVGGMQKSVNMQGRGSHENPLTYVVTEAGREVLAAYRSK